MKAEDCLRTWATTRSTWISCARAPACRPSRCPRNFYAWSSMAASPRSREGCSSGWKRGSGKRPPRHDVNKNGGNKMYDVLVYLFENCQQTDVAYDRERVAK